VVKTHWFANNIFIYALVWWSNLCCVCWNTTMKMFSWGWHLTATICIILYKSRISVKIFLSSYASRQNRFTWVLPCIRMRIVLKLIQVILLKWILILIVLLVEIIVWRFLINTMMHILSFSFNFWIETLCSVWNAWSVTRHVVMLWTPCCRWLTKFSMLTIWIFVLVSSQVWVWVCVALFLRSILFCSCSIWMILISIIYFIYLSTWSLFKIVSWVIFDKLSIVLLLILALLLAILMLGQRILLSCSTWNTYSF
jgi:hypothetical protein